MQSKFVNSRQIRLDYPVGDTLNHAIFSRQLRAPTKKIILYLSSETSDVESEKSLLNIIVATQLREKARACGIQVVIIDLNSNGSSGDSHEGTEIPLDWVSRRTEIERGYEQSIGLFFVSLQSDKYGTTLLPMQVDKNSFEYRRRQLKDTTQLDAYFVLDTNTVPPVYVLKTTSPLFDQGIVDLLKEQLKDTVFDPRYGDGGLVVGRSTTEYEVKTAISICQDNDVPASRCLRWFHRKFEGDASSSSSSSSTIQPVTTEAASAMKLKNLKAVMEGVLLASNAETGAADVNATSVHVFKVNAQAASARGQGMWSEHLKRWELTVKSSLMAHLDGIIKARTQWLRHGKNVGVDAGVMDEMAFHAQIVADEMSTFVGREASIAEALAIIGVSNDTPKQPHQLSPSASSSFMLPFAIVEVNNDDGRKMANGDIDHAVAGTNTGRQGPPAVVSGGYGEGPDRDEEHYDDPGGDDDEWDEDLAGYFLEAQRGVGGVASDSDAAAHLSSVRGVALGVVGRRGSGKSAFIACLAKTLFEREGTPPLRRSTSTSDVAAATTGTSSPSNEAKSNNHRSSSGGSQQRVVQPQPPLSPSPPPYRPVVVRFCGLTRSSSSGLALVRSLCSEMHLLTVQEPVFLETGGYKTPAAASAFLSSIVPRGYDEAVAMLHGFLHDHPFILLLDGLDRLADDDLAKSKISFLRGVRPHPSTRIIVSATRDGPRQPLVQPSPPIVTPVSSKSNLKKFGKDIQRAQIAPLGGSFITKEIQPQPIVEPYYGCETALQDNGVPLLVLPEFSIGISGTSVKAQTGVIEVDNGGMESAGDVADVVTKSFHQSMALSEKGEMSRKDSITTTMAATVTFSSSHIDISEGNNADDNAPTARLSESSSDDADRSSNQDDDEAAVAAAAEAAALDAFESSEAKDVILSQLRARGRVLTPSQLRYIALQIRGVPCTAHLLTLVAHSSHGWRSFDDMDPSTHPVTPLSELSLCDQILRDLENKFGTKLVRAACGFITWAKHGVSDTEIEDLLSLHTDVLDSCVSGDHPGHSSEATMTDEPTLRRIPSALWIRLRAAMRSLFVERDGGGLQWRNRTFQTIAERRYGAPPSEKHTLVLLMAQYFVDIVAMPIVTSRGISRHPVAFNHPLRQPQQPSQNASNPDYASLGPSSLTSVEGDVWLAAVDDCDLIDVRRLEEGYDHLKSSGLLLEAVRELCSLEVLCARFKAGLGRSVVDRFPPLLASLTAAAAIDDFGAELFTTDLSLRVNHYFRWLMADGALLHRNPGMLLASCTGQALTSLARLDAERLIASSSSGSMSSVDHEWWVRCRCVGGRGVLNPLVTMLSHGVVSRSVNGLLPAQTGSSLVTATAWSPCGARLISTSTDRSVKLWDAECGRLLNILDGHSDAVLCVEWSPDSNLLATGSKDKTAILWDMSPSSSSSSSTTLSSSSLASSADGGPGQGPGPLLCTKRCVLRGHNGAVTALTWSPDSWIVATGSADHHIFLWHVINGGEDVRITSVLLGYTNTMEGHCWTVNSVHYNSKGTQLLTGSSDNIVRVWTVHDGEQIDAFEDHKEKVLSVGWAPDGVCFVSGSADRAVNLWDAERHERMTLEGHHDAVTAVAFDASGTRFASGSLDKTVRVWSFATGRTIAVLDGHTSGIRCLQWRRDGVRLVTAGGADRSAGVWQPPAVDEESLPCPHRHTATVYSVSWSPDGDTLASASWDQSVALWDASDAFGACVRTHLGHENIVYAVAFSSDGQVLASGSADSLVHLRSVATGDVTTVLAGHVASVRCLCFRPDDKLIASGGDDKTVRIWNVETGELLRVLEGHENVVYCVSWNPVNVDLLASGSWDTTVAVWHATIGDVLYRLTGHVDSVRCLAWSTDGRELYSGSHDSKVFVWGYHGNDDTGPWSSGESSNNDNSNNTNEEGDIDTPVLIAPPVVLAVLTGHHGGVRALSVSPDGRRLASGSHDCTIRLWCLTTRTTVIVLPVCHTAPVIALAFSPDGRRIASGSHDSTVGLWDCCPSSSSSHEHTSITGLTNTRPNSPTTLLATSSSPHNGGGDRGPASTIGKGGRVMVYNGRISIIR